MAIYLTVDKRAVDNALQVSIGSADESGAGHGYRIAGPKYDGSGTLLVRKRLSKRDAQEIMSFLNQIEDDPR